MELHTIGIDLGKTSFYLVGLNRSGEVMAQRSKPALSEPGLGRSLLRPPNYMGRGRRAFHPGPESCTPTKAVYTCSGYGITANRR